MLNIIKVPMPEKKIYCAKRKDIVYVYRILKAYRNEKGQPTCDSVLIGKKDIESGMLVPNDKYFDYYDCEITINYKGEKNDSK